MKASECKNFNHAAILEEDSLNQFFEVRSNEVSESAAALTEVHILDPSKSRKSKSVDESIAEEFAIVRISYILARDLNKRWHIEVGEASHVREEASVRNVGNMTEIYLLKEWSIE